MDSSSDLWALITQPQTVAGVLVALYAWKRYGTPRSNQSSTTRAQFYSTGCAYVVCALAIYFVLNSVIGQPGAKEFITFGAQLPSEASDEVSKLSAPFVSALFLTTLLPSIPFLSQIDSALLRFFQHLGSIPIEVRRLKRDLQQMDYTPPKSTQTLARNYLGPYPKILTARLAFDQGISIQHQFTRVICLYCELKDLDERSGFLGDFADEAAEVEKLVALVCAQAGGYFAFMQMPGVATDAVDDATGAFEKACDAADNKICWLFARGLLNASWSGNKLRQRLGNLGFGVAKMQPPFILNAALTAGLIVFGVFVCGMFVLRAMGSTELPINRQVTLALVIAVNYGLAAMLATLPKKMWPFAKRTQERGRSVLSYVISAALTGLAAMCVGLLHTIAWEGSIEAGAARYFAVSYPWIVPPVVVALVLAFLCDNYALERNDPTWLRWAEGGVMGLAVAASTIGASIWFRDLLQSVSGPVAGVPAGAPSPAAYTAIVIAISIAIGLTLGSLVPYAYRRARRAGDERPAAPVLQPVAVVSAVDGANPANPKPAVI